MFENIYTPSVYIYYVIIIFPDPLPPLISNSKHWADPLPPLKCLRNICIGKLTFWRKNTLILIKYFKVIFRYFEEILLPQLFALKNINPFCIHILRNQKFSRPPPPP